MKTVRRDKERGAVNFGWLQSQHTFSFGNYYDPNHMGFGALRVINQDRVKPGAGFDTHPHKNMEILSYVVSGELAHRDSMGNGRTIKAGEFQGMSAGSGITHSEFNPSDTSEVHFIQIWIVPRENNIVPSYSEWKPSQSNGTNLILVASSSGQDGSMVIHQDAKIYLGKYKAAERLHYTLGENRRAWIQVIEGSLAIDGEHLVDGDGIALENESALSIDVHAQSRFLLFDLS